MKLKNEPKVSILSKIKIRHPLAIVFFICFVLTIAFVNLDLKKTQKPRYIKDEVLVARQVNQKTEMVTIYTDKIQVNVFYPDKKYEAGDVIKVSGLLTDNRDAQKSGYNLYLKSKGYHYSINVQDVELIGKKLSPYTYILKLKEELNKRIDRLYFEHSGIIRALITADRGFIRSSDKELFSKSGISHLVSISGFHILLISGIFYKMLFFLTVKSRHISSATLTFVYVGLTGFGSPCVRAYVFYITYLLSVALNKRYDIYSVGFILASICLILNPYTIFDAGFCLSFLSVFSIAMFYKWIFGFLSKGVSSEVLKVILSLAAMTISAQILTLPYVAIYFNIFATYSVIANVIAVPLVSLSYPLILLSLVLYPITPIAKVFAGVVDMVLNIFYWYISSVVELPFSYFEFGENINTHMMLYSGIVLGIYFLKVRYDIRKNLLPIE